MNNNKNSGGVSIFTVLTLIFVVLKLCGLVNWSWVWVLSPVWIGAILVVILLIINVIIVLHDDNKKNSRSTDKWKF